MRSTGACLVGGPLRALVSTMAKQYTIRKVRPEEQEGPAMLGRFEDMWSASESKKTQLDFTKVTDLEMFVEREPIVEEEDEEDRLKLEEEAAKVARGVKKARRKKKGQEPEPKGKGKGKAGAGAGAGANKKGKFGGFSKR